MTRTLATITATTAAIALAAAFVTAQGPSGQDQQNGAAILQGPQTPPQGQVGPGRGRRGAPGAGQALGGGRQAGPPAGRGGPERGLQARGRARGIGAQGRAALDLTEDQRATITGLQRAMRDQAAPLEDELAFSRKTLHRELFADTRDTAKIASLTARIATLAQQLADLHVKQATAVADLLTPEQRETMRLADGRRAGRGRGPGGPGPGRGRGGFAGGGQGGMAPAAK